VIFDGLPLQDFGGNPHTISFKNLMQLLIDDFEHFKVVAIIE